MRGSELPKWQRLLPLLYCNTDGKNSEFLQPGEVKGHRKGRGTQTTHYGVFIPGCCDGNCTHITSHLARLVKCILYHRQEMTGIHLMVVQATRSSVWLCQKGSLIGAFLMKNVVGLRQLIFSKKKRRQQVPYHIGLSYNVTLAFLQSRVGECTIEVLLH